VPGSPGAAAACARGSRSTRRGASPATARRAPASRPILSRAEIGSLAGKTPLRTVGSYWPYATTLFDYVRRAMPITNPLSLTDDEVYAVSAYVLFLNGIVGEDAVMTRRRCRR